MSLMGRNCSFFDQGGKVRNRAQRRHRENAVADRGLSTRSCQSASGSAGASMSILLTGPAVGIAALDDRAAAAAALPALQLFDLRVVRGA